MLPEQGMPVPYHRLHMADNKEFDRVRFIGKVISNMKLVLDKKVALIELPSNFGHEFGIEIGDTSDIISYGLQIKGVEVTLLIKEVENGVTGIVEGLRNFGIEIDEGMITETDSIGNYGPYTQSMRKEIYQTYAKSLVERGLAYPCFCTAEELDEIRKEQEANKQNPGYYGKFAKCRDLTFEEIEEKGGC